MAFFDDLLYALRRLRQRPAFVAIACLTLALGIGFNATMFSFVNFFLLRPLPVQEPDRVVSLSFGRSGATQQVSYPDFVDIRDRNQVFTSVAATRAMPMALSMTGKNQRIWGYLVSGNYFDLLGISAWRGRLLGVSDDLKTGANPVAVISYGCWQRRFGGDPGAIGRTVKINGYPFTILGVTPPGFIGTERFFASEIWVPLSMIREIEGRDWRAGRSNRNAWSIGRLRRGVNLNQAEASLKVLAAEMAAEHPDTSEGFGIHLSPPGLLGNTLRRPVTGIGLALMIVSALTLLVACTNLSGLLLAHAADRRKEIAIRLSIGATRNAILRMMLTENLLLAAGGGALGLLAAKWLCGALDHFIPALDLPLNTAIQVDGRVIVFCGVVSLLCAVVSGFLPAWRAAGLDTAPALKDESSAALPRGWHLRDVYVCIQVAVCAVLLAGSVMMVRTLRDAMTTRFGFDPDHAVALRVDLAMQRYTPEKGQIFQRQLIESVRSLPGVEAAGLSNSIPFSVDESNSSVLVEGKPVPPPSRRTVAVVYQTGPDYFRAAGTHVLAGREFTERDGAKAPRVAIVNQTFVDKLLPGENALGKRLRFGTSGEWKQIIGVVEAGKYETITEDPKPAVWESLAQAYNSSTSVVVRTRLRESEALAAAVAAVARIDPDLPVFEAKSLREYMDLPLIPLRLTTGSLTAMGGLAALLCALGLYGLLANSVVQRTHEVGIRMALGARSVDVLGLLIRRMALLVGVGSAAGLILAFFSTRLLASLLYANASPSVYVDVVMLVAVIAAMASIVPAARVLRIDPWIALRHQ
ncbi:MAG: ABC transporter permease [Bryobacteraceae bacterium]